MKKHWFYSIGPTKYQHKHWFYSIGPKTYKKQLVLQTGPPKWLKNHWFYRPGHRKHEKNIGFITVKPVRATGPPDPGHGFGVWVANTRLEIL